ncbi:MAG TPA: RluA family pseudouridine synthase [Gemmatimonadaceae bacterium]|nr:RluA family pseudouridine synthase [Gemmatimonadaceae bacterium]
MTRGDSAAAAGSTPAGARHSFLVEADSDVRLDSLVASRLEISRTQAATLIATGRVTVAGGGLRRRERAAYRARAGETVEVEIPPPPDRTVVPESIPLDIVFEDEHIAVVNKPAGMVVHPAPGNWTGTLVNALVGRGGELSAEGGEDRAGIVHRLDKDTSGLLLVAKSDRAHRVLGAAIAGRHVSRRYAALCWGHLDAERIDVDKPLGRDPRDRKRMAVVANGRAAKTTFRRLARFDPADLLQAQLHTGRTHQIRVHLQAIGHPVVGDDVYGGGGGRRLTGLPPRRHFLHAAWLVFRHPVTGAQMDLRSPLPEDLRRSLVTTAGMPELVDHPDPLDYFGFYRAGA